MVVLENLISLRETYRNSYSFDDYEAPETLSINAK